MSYWNKIALNKILGSKSKKETCKYTVKTDIGRFYFFFKKDIEDDSRISGKLVFFPNKQY